MTRPLLFDEPLIPATHRWRGIDLELLKSRAMSVHEMLRLIMDFFRLYSPTESGRGLIEALKQIAELKQQLRDAKRK